MRWFRGIAGSLIALGCNSPAKEESSKLSASEYVQTVTKRIEDERSRGTKPTAEAAVLGTFQRYREALLKKDGVAAAQVVSRDALDFYERCRNLALDASETEVRGLPLAEKLFVVSFRGRLTPQEIRASNGARLFELGVERGWIQTDQLSRTQLGPISAESGRATAQAMVDGRLSPMHYSFVETDGRWYVDLVPLLRLIGAALEAEATRSGQPVDALLEKVIELEEGKAAAARIWRPVEAANPPG